MMIDPIFDPAFMPRRRKRLALGIAINALGLACVVAQFAGTAAAAVIA